MHSSQAHRNRKFYTGLPLDANSNEDGRSLTSKRRRFFRGILRLLETLENNLHFINFIEKTKVSQNTILVSIDVTSLYTNIPQEEGIGPLHDPVTWYKIKNTGEQNNAPAFVLEVPLRNLLTSIFNFVPCDRVVQRAYYNGMQGIRKISRLQSSHPIPLSQRDALPYP